MEIFVFLFPGTLPPNPSANLERNITRLPSAPCAGAVPKHGDHDCLHEGSVARGAFAQGLGCSEPPVAFAPQCRGGAGFGQSRWQQGQHPPRHRYGSASAVQKKNNKKNKKPTSLVANSRHSPAQMGLNYLKCFSRELALAV